MFPISKETLTYVYRLYQPSDTITESLNICEFKIPKFLLIWKKYLSLGSCLVVSHFISVHHYLMCVCIQFGPWSWPLTSEPRSYSYYIRVKVWYWTNFCYEIQLSTVQHYNTHDMNTHIHTYIWVVFYRVPLYWVLMEDPYACNMFCLYSCICYVS